MTNEIIIWKIYGWVYQWRIQIICIELMNFGGFLRQYGILFNIGLILLLGFSRFSPRPIYPLLVREIAAPGFGVATQTGLINAAAGVAAVLAGISIGRRADRAQRHRGRIYLLGIACALLAAAFFVPQGFMPSVWTLLPLVFAGCYNVDFISFQCTY